MTPAHAPRQIGDGSHAVDKEPGGWRALCGAIAGCALEHLGLADVGVGPVGLAVLGRAFAPGSALCAGCRGLDLSANPGALGELHSWGALKAADAHTAGFASLCTALSQAPRLAALELANCGMGPAGLALLAGVFAAGAPLTGVLCPWEERRGQCAQTHNAHNANTHTRAHTQRQTDTHTRADTHRHTQTHAHTNTESGRCRCFFP